MHGVRVKDLAPAGFLAFDLRDFLGLLGDAVEASRWLVSRVWATGDRCGDLEAAASDGEPIPGARLREIASAVTQVIDGEFAAYRPGESEPWVIIRAEDSTFYEVFSTNPEVLQRVRERFTVIAEDEYEPYE